LPDDAAEGEEGKLAPDDDSETVFSERVAEFSRDRRIACRLEVRVSSAAGREAFGDVQVTVWTDMPGDDVRLHWGVVPHGPFGDNHWQAAEEAVAEAAAAGTTRYNKTASQTPLPAAASDGGREVVLRFAATAAPRAINFVLHDLERNSWTHTSSGAVFHVPLPPRTAALAAQAAVDRARSMATLLSALQTAIVTSEVAPAESNGSLAEWQPTYSRSEIVTALRSRAQRLAVRVTRHGAGGVRLRCACDIADAPLALHWGVVPRGARDDIWAAPPPAIWPPGSCAVGSSALQSPMVLGADGLAHIQLELGCDCAAVHFVLREEGGGPRGGATWYDDAGHDFFIVLPPPPAGAAAAEADGPSSPLLDSPREAGAAEAAEAEGAGAGAESEVAAIAVRAEAERLEWLAAEAGRQRRSSDAEAAAAGGMERRLLQLRERELAEAVLRAPPPSELQLPPSPAPAAEAAQLEPAPAAPEPARNIGTGSGREVLLQGFNWDSWKVKEGWYAKLAAAAPELAALGATVVWLPPPTDSVSAEGYLPRDLYDLNSRYGSMAQLRACVAALQAAGLKTLGDAVLNHRCAHAQNEAGVWNRFGGRLAWDERAIVCDDPHFGGKGNRSQGDNFPAAPNIDHSQPFVRRDIREWLAWLREEVGFDGWRLDYVRGFSGDAVRDYLAHTEPSFAVGEYWDTLAYRGSEPEYNQDAHRQRIVDWLNAAGGLAGAFDVTTKGILHAALERREYWRLSDAKGKPPGVLGWWPSRAVTFIEARAAAGEAAARALTPPAPQNHDTGSSQGHWRFPAGKEMQGYCYILTHPGTPCIFWDHAFEWRLQGLRGLVELRKRSGVHCRSQVCILLAEREAYVAKIDDALLVRLGPKPWEPTGEEAKRWQRAEHGQDWCTWQRRA